MKVKKQERDLCYFENYPRKKTCAFIVARLLSASVLIENKNLGGELVGGETPWRRDDR